MSQTTFKYRGLFSIRHLGDLAFVLGEYGCEKVLATLGDCKSEWFWVDIDGKWLIVWEHK